ncbi:hypothetical protein ACIPJR_21020 [Pseudomonas aeruginosa]
MQFGLVLGPLLLSFFAFVKQRLGLFGQHFAQFRELAIQVALLLVSLLRLDCQVGIQPFSLAGGFAALFVECREQTFLDSLETLFQV